jgi:hypothetical protein
MGFTPTALARQYRENRALKNYEQHILDRRAALMNAFALAVRTGDESLRSATLDRIATFNGKYPQIPISAATLRQSLRARARAAALADNGLLLNRKLEGVLRERVAAD